VNEFLSFMADNSTEVALKTREHLVLVLLAILIASLIAVPLGIAAAKWPRLRTPVIGTANIVQTIPSLALFGFLIPLPFIGGIGPRTAIIALVLYALLPIVRNTYAGIEAVSPALRDAALGMGMTGRQLLLLVELPLALPILLGGIRVAAVTGVGVATIASLIGAGGLGDFIFRGVSTVDSVVILAGAVPAALMALMIDGGLHLLEKKLDWKQT
jgi:osmoprotectant transport system permease protein